MLLNLGQHSQPECSGHTSPVGVQLNQLRGRSLPVPAGSRVGERFRPQVGLIRSKSLRRSPAMTAVRNSAGRNPALQDDVVRVANLLGYDERQLTGENTVKVYARYGIELSSIKELRF